MGCLGGVGWRESIRTLGHAPARRSRVAPPSVVPGHRGSPSNGQLEDSTERFPAGRPQSPARPLPLARAELDAPPGGGRAGACHAHRDRRRLEAGRAVNPHAGRTGMGYEDFLRWQCECRGCIASGLGAVCRQPATRGIYVDNARSHAGCDAECGVSGWASSAGRGRTVGLLRREVLASGVSTLLSELCLRRHGLAPAPAFWPME